MQMPELGYLRNVHRSVLDALQLTITLAGQSKFEEASRECRRVSGALHMSRFEGAARVMDDAVEYALLAAKGGTDAERAGKPVDVLTTVCQATRQYVLDALANAPDIPMKLWESYRMVRMGRKLGAHPSQLFFPQIDGGWHASNATHTPSQDAFLAARSNLSAALLPWLQNPQQVDALQSVQKIIKGVLVSAPLSASHVGFFNAAMAAIDTVKQKEKPDAFDRLVLGRVDAEMKYLADGKTQPNEDGWRYLLYVVAFGGAKTETVNDVMVRHDLFAYSEMIKQEARRQGKTLDEVSLQPIKESLANVKDAWAKFSSGGNISEMEKPAQILSERLPAFEHPSIKRLGDALLQLTHGLKSQQIKLSESLSEEVASMLMLIEQAVDAKGRVSEQFESRALSQIRRTLTAVKNDSLALAEMPDTAVDEEVQVRSRRVLREHVLLEVKQELQTAEESLDAWFRDEEKDGSDDVIKSAQPLKRLVHVLLMTQLPEASRVLSEVLASLQVMLNKQKHLVSEQDCSIISEKMASLGLYLDAEITEQEGDLRFLNLSPVVEISEKEIAPITSFEINSFKLTSDNQVEIAPVAEAKDLDVKKVEFTVQPKFEAERSEGDVDVVTDIMMLEVYLEDFDEQMETLKQGSLNLSQDQKNKNALIDIRRAFHTLKGSGRMVAGLVRLPNVAEKIEAFLKKWISEDRAATDQLMGAIEDAINLFDGWRTSLKNTKTVTVNSNDILHAFDPSQYEEYKVESIQTEPSTNENAVVGTAADDVPAKSDKVFVGTMVVDRVMYEMYLEEADDQIETIKKEWVFTKNSPQKRVSREFMRAGHTLGSTSKTLQFTALAEVGYLVERWAEKRMDGGAWIGQKEENDIDALINHVQELYQAVVNKDGLHLNKECLNAVESWLTKESVVHSEVVQPSWTKSDMQDSELKKRLKAKLEKEIAVIRSHLGELESMLMLVDTDVDGD